MLSHKCLNPQAVDNSTTTLYSGAAVEPSIAVHPTDPQKMVVAWQQGRFSNGAALQIGVSWTADGGATWHQSQAAFQTCCSACPSAASAQRVGDAWLSYSADGQSVYMCVALQNATPAAATSALAGIGITQSEDGGKSWTSPRYLYSSLVDISHSPSQFANPDKPSVTAHLALALAARAMAVWVNFNPGSSSHGDVYGNLTVDGGQHWSAPLLVYDPFPDLAARKLSNGLHNDCSASNNQVVFLPDGQTALNFTVRTYARPGSTDEQYTTDSFPYKHTLVDIAVVRSCNLGFDWETEASVVVPSFVNNLLYTGGYTYATHPVGPEITGGVGTLMRNDQTVPAYTVDPTTGDLYVAFQSSMFRPDQLNQIGLTVSRDGGRTWTRPVRANRTPQTAANPQAFAPAVAVAGGQHVGLLYFDFRFDGEPHATLIDAWLAIYRRDGLEFVQELRLSARSYVAQRGPTTSAGNMVEGDYQFLVARGASFFAAYTKSVDEAVPLRPSTVFFQDAERNATLLLDDNVRTATFVSTIKAAGSRGETFTVTSTARLDARDKCAGPGGGAECHSRGVCG